MMRGLSKAAALTIALLAAGAAWAEAPEQKPPSEDKKPGPPFADKKKAAGEKPAERVWNVIAEGEGGKFALSFQFKPAIPDPGQVTELTIAASAVPKTPDPRFGNRVPLANAEVVVELKSPGGQLVGRYLAHPVPLSQGKYAVHMTPAQDGIYTVAVRSNYQGAKVEGEAKLPVNVWPLPAELEGSGAEADASVGRRPVKR